MLALLPAQQIGELIAVLNTALREVASPADVEEAPDGGCRRRRIIFRKLQIAANIGDPKFVEQVGGKDVGFADRRILIENILSPRVERAELGVARNVCIIRLVVSIA